MGHKPGNSCLAVGPRDADNGDRVWALPGKQIVNDCIPHRTPRPLSGKQMHPDSRGGIHLNHCPLPRQQGLSDILGNNVDAGDIQAEQTGNPAGQPYIFPMYQVGDICGCAAGRQVGVVPQVYHLARGRDIIHRQVLPGEDVEDNLINFYFRQRFFMLFSPQGVAVFNFNQFLDRIDAVTGHQGWEPFRNCNDFIVDHQNAVMASKDLFLYQHFAAVVFRNLVRRAHLGFTGQVETDPLALIAVAGLDHCRYPHLFDNGHRIFFIPGNFAPGSGD